jgi:hypothetical protein
VSIFNKIKKRTVFIVSLSVNLSHRKSEAGGTIYCLCHDVIMPAVTKPSSLMKHALLYRMNLGNMTTPEEALPPLGYRVHVAVFCTPSQRNIYCLELVSAGVSYVGWMWIVNRRHPNSREQTVVVNTEVMVRRLYIVVNNGAHLRFPVLTTTGASVFPAGRLSVFVYS